MFSVSTTNGHWSFDWWLFRLAAPSNNQADGSACQLALLFAVEDRKIRNRNGRFFSDIFCWFPQVLDSILSIFRKISSWSLAVFFGDIMADSVDRAAIWQRLQALTESQKSLQHNWVEHKSPDSDETYYYNSESKESVWEKPVELQTAGEIVLSESTWKEYKDPEGKIYFHNIETGNQSINQSMIRSMDCLL